MNSLFAKITNPSANYIPRRPGSLQNCPLHMDFTSLINDYGAAGLFLVSFLGATILPFSSEAALLAALVSGMDSWSALIVSSAGNCLACTVNYAMGFAGGRFTYKILLTRRGKLVNRIYIKFKTLSLLLSWMPVLGDFFTIVAGLFRYPFYRFMLIVFSVRIGRYVILMWMTGYF